MYALFFSLPSSARGGSLPCGLEQNDRAGHARVQRLKPAPQRYRYRAVEAPCRFRRDPARFVADDDSGSMTPVNIRIRHRGAGVGSKALRAAAQEELGVAPVQSSDRQPELRA